MNATAFDVFISYSSKNKQIADAVKHGLHSAGIRCWMAPDDIQPGGDWAAEVADAIEACSVMVLIWTSASMSSVEVPKELGLAMSSGSIVIPFRLEKIEPHGSFKYHLAGRHWLDAYDTDLDESIKQLTELVRTNIDKFRASEDAGSVVISSSEVIAGIGADMHQAAGIPNEDQDFRLGTSSVSYPLQISNVSTVEPPGSNHAASSMQETAMQDVYTEEIKGDALDGDSELRIESYSLLQDSGVSASPEKAHAFEQIVEEAEVALADKDPRSLVGPPEETRLGTTEKSTNVCPESDELSKLAREIELICYSVEVLVPELDKTILKRSFISRKVMGARCAPSAGELIEVFATNMHFTFLLIATYCLVSSADNIQTGAIREFIGSEQTRSSSRSIYENAACILKILHKDDGPPLDVQELEDCNHGIFVDDASCCIEIVDLEGACVFRFIDPSSGDVLFDTKAKSVPVDRVNDAFARILDIDQALLPAVISMADTVLPSDPSLRRIVAERLCYFACWSLDAAASSVGEFLGVADVCNREFFVKLKSLSTIPAMEDAIARLSGCRKVDASKIDASSLNIAFDRLMKFSTLKMAAGVTVKC
jgi:hypothetical protein